MLHTILEGDMKPFNLTPWAAVHKPISYFSSIPRVEFTDGIDDLDEYQGVFLKWYGLPFALIHYQHEPVDMLTLYLPTALPDAKAQIAGLLRLFDLPERSVTLLGGADDHIE